MLPPKSHRIVRQGPSVASLDGQYSAVAVADNPAQEIQAPPGPQPAALRSGALQDSTTLPAPRAP